MKNRPLRKGDIVFVCNNSDVVEGVQNGSRPYIVVSNDKFNMYSPVVNCVPLTTKQKKYSPVHLFIHKEIGIPHNSYALCEQIFTISKNNVEKIICILPDNLLDKLNSLLVFQLAL